MVKINCKTKDTIKLTDCVPFQGNLKKRTDQDIKALTDSLLTEGLMMPFAIWVHEDKKYLLDGHGRKEALTRLAVDDASILTVDWPCIFIDAASEDDARKALLQITSQYGKITKSGVKQFCVSIPDYKAPSIAKFVAKPVKKEIKVNDKPEVNNDRRVIKIRVAESKVKELLETLKAFDWIEVL